MDPNNNEGTRLWRVFRTAHQMVHDRVNIAFILVENEIINTDSKIVIVGLFGFSI
jgi:hypothetical protein